ncbi:MAG: SRPBCC domain-containing protein, partial [Anaerolineales bacterium]
QCAPGLESLEIREPGRKFRAVASVGLGSMRARFTLDVEWLELKEPDLARMSVHGTASGSTADITSQIELRDSAQGGTDLSWTADAAIRGPLASLASRLMGSAAQKVSNEFFDCVRRHVETPAARAAGS